MTAQIFLSEADQYFEHGLYAEAAGLYGIAAMFARDDTTRNHCMDQARGASEAASLVATQRAREVEQLEQMYAR